jgi:hypothetical protein
MPRLRNRGYDPRGRESVDLLLALRMGPDMYDDGFTDDELRVGWGIYGAGILAGKPNRGPGTRPWGWWRFVAGEEQPRERWNPETNHIEDRGCETIRLAELGALTPEELALLEEDANVARTRIGTDAEHISGGWRNTPGAESVDQLDVDLWENVQAALRDGTA